MGRLRDCFRLQRVTQGMSLLDRPFGRAEVDTGNLGPAGLDAPDRYYRLYWMKLPVFDYRHLIWSDRYAMCQAVLVFHGQRGFLIVWRECARERIGQP